VNNNDWTTQWWSNNYDSILAKIDIKTSNGDNESVKSTETIESVEITRIDIRKSGKKEEVFIGKKRKRTIKILKI
jgi:hypothetical protein